MAPLAQVLVLGAIGAGSVGFGVLCILMARRLNERADRRRTVAILSALQAANLGEPPPELRHAPPRPDVFSGRGYLQQARYRAAYLPLLQCGHVARALCVRYRSTSDSEGPDVRFEYAWIDHAGELRRESREESYDAMHAALSAGKGDIIVDMDAGMREGRVVTVVYYADRSEHVIYDALCIHP